MQDIDSIFMETDDAGELRQKIAEFIEDGFVPKDMFEKVNSEFECFKAQRAAELKDAAVEKAIAEAGGRNAKAIKALIDMEKVVLNDDGTVGGLDIESIRKSDGYLFNKEESVMESTGFTRASAAAEKSIGSRIAEAMGIKI